MISMTRLHGDMSMKALTSLFERTKAQRTYHAGPLENNVHRHTDIQAIPTGVWQPGLQAPSPKAACVFMSGLISMYKSQNFGRKAHASRKMRTWGRSR